MVRFSEIDADHLDVSKPLHGESKLQVGFQLRLLSV